MYLKMIEKLNDYLEKALECETIIMATLLHPTIWLRIFHEFWPESENDAKQLLDQHFKKKDAILKKKKQTNIELLEQDPNQNTFANENDVFARFNAPQSTEESKEFEVYINNMDWLQGPNSKDPKSLLIWWKVFIY